MPLTVFRLANVYGPRNLSGPIPTFYKRLKAGETCTVVDTRREMVYVDDLVDAVMTAVDEDISGWFDICSGHALPITALYWAVARELDVDTKPKLMASAEDDVIQMDLNPYDARKQLGWRPTTSLETGVESAVDWYDEHGVDETYTHLSMKAA